MTLDINRPVLLDTREHQKTQKKQRMKTSPASDTYIYFIKVLLCVFLSMGGVF